MTIRLTTDGGTAVPFENLDVAAKALAKSRILGQRGPARATVGLTRDRELTRDENEQLVALAVGWLERLDAGEVRREQAQAGEDVDAILAQANGTTRRRAA